MVFIEQTTHTHTLSLRGNVCGDQLASQESSLYAYINWTIVR